MDGIMWSPKSQLDWCDSRTYVNCTEERNNETCEKNEEELPEHVGTQEETFSRESVVLPTVRWSEQIRTGNVYSPKPEGTEYWSGLHLFIGLNRLSSRLLLSSWFSSFPLFTKRIWQYAQVPQESYQHTQNREMILSCLCILPFACTGFFEVIYIKSVYDLTDTLFFLKIWNSRF